MIELSSVSVSVRGVRILDACTATLESASITHLAGANGSGKTTLIRAISGIQNYSGSIRFAVGSGEGPTMGLAEVRSRLYVAWEDAAVFPYLSGYENLRMVLGRPVRRREAASLAPAIADHALLRMTARKLSHGQRKRVHLLAALLSGADYLILDEALSGVDAPTVGEVAAALRRHASAATVLLTGHDASESTTAYGALATRRLELVEGTLRSVGSTV